MGPPFFAAVNCGSSRVSTGHVWSITAQQTASRKVFGGLAAQQIQDGGRQVLKFSRHLAGSIKTRSLTQHPILHRSAVCSVTTYAKVRRRTYAADLLTVDNIRE